MILDKTIQRICWWIISWHEAVWVRKACRLLGNICKGRGEFRKASRAREAVTPQGWCFNLQGKSEVGGYCFACVVDIQDVQDSDCYRTFVDFSCRNCT